MVSHLGRTLNRLVEGFLSPLFGFIIQLIVGVATGIVESADNPDPLLGIICTVILALIVVFDELHRIRDITDSRNALDLVAYIGGLVAGYVVYGQFLYRGGLQENNYARF